MQNSDESQVVNFLRMNEGKKSEGQKEDIPENHVASQTYVHIAPLQYTFD